MVLLVDTHVHLCDPVFDPDRPEVLARARTAGVGRVIAVAENLADAERNLQLAAEFPHIVLPAAGLFPTVLDLDQADAMLHFIRRHRARLVAIGEVGLDRWKVQDAEGQELQKEIFSRFIDLSVEVGLPLNVHSRAAGRQTIDLLIERGAENVQLHAFDGKAANALPGVESGYYFSVPPSIVRSAQKQRLVRRLPLDCLLVETDSPVLGPDAAVRNEPANAEISVGAIAEIKQVPRVEVEAAVAANTMRLYGSLAPAESI